MNKRVNLFLPNDAEPDDPDNNPFNLQPVERLVDAQAPARPMLQQLLKGPDKVEQAKGFMELDASELSIGSLQIKDGVCTVDFASQGPKKWKGDLSPAIFRSSVEKSLSQFSTVKSIRISVNGDSDFDSLQ